MGDAADIVQQSFQANCEGSGPGKGFRKLREGELKQLNEELHQFSDDATKISSEEIEFKKGRTNNNHCFSWQHLNIEIRVFRWLFREAVPDLNLHFGLPC